MIGVIYARYSEGPEQTDQSIEGQVADCKAYAEAEGIQIIEVYADRHISGKSLEGRDEFQRMMYDAEHHRFDCVIVWKIDRFGRNRQDIAVCKMKLKRAGVQLRYAKESIPEGPEGIILESVLEGLAEYYSADLRQKVSRGIRESAKKGKYCGASLPIGYDTDADRHVIVNKKEAEAVLKAFEMHIEGATTADIIDMFRRRSISSKRGGKITPAVIYRMLRNDRYIGHWELAGVPMDIPGIVPEEIFYEAQKHFKTSRNNAANTAKTDFLLSCKCYCGYCHKLLRGSTATGKLGKKYHYYECGGKKTGKACKFKAVSRDLLDDVIVKATREEMLVPEVIDEVVAKVMEIQQQDQENDRVNALQRHLKDLEKRQDKLLKALELAGGDLEIVTSRLVEISAEIKEIKKEIAVESVKRPLLSENVIRFWLNSFKDGDLSDPEVRRRLVETFIDHVELKNGEALIFFNKSEQGRKSSPTIRQVESESLWANTSPFCVRGNYIIIKTKIPA